MNPVLYAKVGAVLLTIAVLFGAGFHFGGMRAEVTLEDYKASAALALADAYVAQQKAADAKQRALETENETLKDDRLKYPDIAVRVCRLAANPVVPATARSGQVVPAGTGVLPQAPVSSDDRGPDLFADADKADAIVAKCRAL